MPMKLGFSLGKLLGVNSDDGLAQKDGMCYTEQVFLVQNG